MTDKILLPVSLGKRPVYHHGQLLEEGDFQDEQKYHSEARQRHNRHAHGWGVVHGLMIHQIDEKKVEVGPGYAIDRIGRDLFLEKNQHLNLSDFNTGQALVYIYYSEGVVGEGDEIPNREDCKAVLAVTMNADELQGDKVFLGEIVIADGKVSSIDNRRTDYVHKHRMFSDWISPQDLTRELQIGWLTLPFHPIDLDREVGDDEHVPGIMRGTLPPPFKVGITEAYSPDDGAGGNMAFPIHPGVTSIKRFRIAGTVNEGDISLMLVVAGWDSKEKKHIYEKRLTHTIKGSLKAPDRGAYEYLGELNENDINPEFNTLVIQLLATSKAHVSLVAVEFGYWGF